MVLGVDGGGGGGRGGGKSMGAEDGGGGGGKSTLCLKHSNSRCVTSLWRPLRNF
jgi:hypothetical protein